MASFKVLQNILSYAYCSSTGDKQQWGWLLLFIFICSEGAICVKIIAFAWATLDLFKQAVKCFI